MAQNLVVEQCEIDFDIIFQFKVAQNMVAKHYVNDFHMIIHFIQFSHEMR